jgi:hypothetical protein
LGEIITGTQICASPDGEPGGYHEPPSTQTSQRTIPQAREIPSTTEFKPINSLWPVKNPQIHAQPTRKFGLGYSQRVRDAFSDSDDSDSNNVDRKVHPNSLRGESPVGREVETPEPFRQWLRDYETNFIAHIGFCSVADGPFKGLIRIGPNKGKYLSGYNSPTRDRIAEMRNITTPKERLDIWDSSENDALDSDADDSDVEVLELPNLIHQTPSSAESNATSVLLMRQFSQEAPPSNQELGILMSSSPSRKTSESKEIQAGWCAFRPGSLMGTPIAISNVDHEPKVPVHLPQNMQSIQNLTPKRGGKPHHRDNDLDVTPGFERALSQVETPSSRSKAVQQTPEKPNYLKEDRGETDHQSRIVVKIHELPVQKLAEYKKIPESFEQVVLATPLKSFKDINRDHEDPSTESQDSGAVAIEHVLQASRSWLAEIPEIEPRAPQTLKKAPYTSKVQARGGKTRSAAGSSSEPQAKDANNSNLTCKPLDTKGQPEGSGRPYTRGSRDMTKKDDCATPDETRKVTMHPSAAHITSPHHKELSRHARKRSIPTDELSFASCTPVPAPTIPELMKKIQAAGNIAHSQEGVPSKAMTKFSPKHKSNPRRHDQADNNPSLTTAQSTTSLPDSIYDSGRKNNPELNMRKHERELNGVANAATSQHEYRTPKRQKTANIPETNVKWEATEQRSEATRQKERVFNEAYIAPNSIGSRRDSMNHVSCIENLVDGGPLTCHSHRASIHKFGRALIPRDIQTSSPTHCRASRASRLKSGLMSLAQLLKCR